MAFISSHRSMTTKTELDIFATPPTQNSVESGTTLCVSRTCTTRKYICNLSTSPHEYIEGLLLLSAVLVRSVVAID